MCVAVSMCRQVLSLVPEPWVSLYPRSTTLGLSTSMLLRAADIGGRGEV